MPNDAAITGVYITEHSAELTYVRYLPLVSEAQGRAMCRITNLHTHGESVQPCADWQERIDTFLLHPLRLDAVVHALNEHGDVIVR